MKRLLVCASLLVAVAALSAQTAMTPAPQKAPPKSPSATAKAIIAGKTITINYSSPGVKGRAGQIFGKGGLISHDPTYPVWRAGANGATIVETDGGITAGRAVEMDGGITAGRVEIPAGKYSLFVDISDPDQWVLIVNKQTGQWGTKYDKTQDLGRVKMTMSKPHEMVENLKFTITNLGGNKGEIALSWETHEAKVMFVVH